MIPSLDAVPPDDALPARTGVVVIGGGIIGINTALSLAERGHAVTVCEKGRIGAEQSARNWGWCRTMGRDLAELPLAIESLRLWRGMDARTEGATGFRQAGTVFLCETERELATQAAWLEQARAFQIDTRLLTGVETEAVLPGAARAFAGALHTPGDGRAEPAHAVPAMARAARRHGANLLTQCAVRGVETLGGRIAGVVTERGRIACDAVVLAGGAWSRLFCGNLGIDLPQLNVLGSVMRVEGVAGAPEAAVGGSIFAFRRRQDGGFTVARRNASISDIVPDSFRLFFDYMPAYRTEWRTLRLRFGRRFFEEWGTRRRWSLDQTTPFEAVRELDPVPSTRVLAQAATELPRVFPAFAPMRVTHRWGGLMDVTPDAVPVISAVGGRPGLFIASGFSGHGFGIGPAAGRLMADLVTGAPPLVDPAPFRLERFARARAAGAMAG
ncbi:MAG: FAD-binding oxidoreductase [Rhodospirillales bacterium]|nr:FAD-binding oxidoreductase [Rhodospirillales bacterium]